jgi:hypothetical protein
MTSRRNGPLKARIALLLALSGVASVFAGEPAPANPAPPVPAPPAATPAEDAEDKWEFSDDGRRDMFTFSKVKKAPVKVVVDETNPSNTDPKKGSPSLAPEEIDSKRREAQKQYEAAEVAMLEGSAKMSVDRCDDGLNVFREVENISQYRELQEVRERLYRLRKAASRVRDRNDADAEFTGLGLRITGIVSRERKSQAIVNGRVVNKGDVISASAEGAEVVVDEIRPDQIIFLYKTYRMALPLTEVSTSSR